MTMDKSCFYTIKDSSSKLSFIIETYKNPDDQFIEELLISLKKLFNTIIEGYERLIEQDLTVKFSTFQEQLDQKLEEISGVTGFLMGL